MKSRQTFSLLYAVAALSVVPFAAIAQSAAQGAPPPRTDVMAPRPAAMSNLLTVEQQKALDAAGRATPAGGRFSQSAPRSADDNLGFVSIFDGKTLSGWDGDPKFWRAEAGSIVGESAPDNPVTRNTFLIWRGGTLQDFELKTDFRMSGTNSGIQFRSRELPQVGKWVLGGYQADMDASNTYTGGMAEERGRHNVMVQRGEMIRVTEDDHYKLLGVTADPDEIARSFVVNGWNTYHIIAKGNLMIQILNGRVSVIMIDEAEKIRATEGVLGLQMHTGAPFKIEFRNLLYRKL
ncbi:MAG: DUF1080 domain-containing protein [Steroidobacteraceae bacterium]